MHWIIQNNIFSEQQWDVLLNTVERFKLSYSEHKVVPFVGELLPEPPQMKNAICIGSYSMRHIAKKNGWYPGVFDIYDQDFEVQRQHWGKHMLNYSSRVCAFKDIDFEDIAFLRPTTDSKVFAGRIFEEKDFKEWQHRVCELGEALNGSSLTPETLIQVSDPINIYAEYRFWVVKGEIITYSLYKRGSQVVYSPDVDQRFIDYVREVIAIWSPHETFVIDVADTADGIKIVEPNTLNAAGFYAGNIQKLIFTLEEKYTL